MASRLRVVELEGLAPIPFCGQFLSDLGADVICVDSMRATSNRPLFRRGKRSIALDLKVPACREALLKLIANSDVLLDPFRPGTLERLGLGPSVLHALNPSLIIARLTGFGQTGPLSAFAGHDLNFVAVSGALPSLPRDANGAPTFPLNFLGDFAGGGMMAAAAVLAAAVRGEGCVMDINMTDGAAYIAGFVDEATAAGVPATQLLAGHAPFYRLYKCAGGAPPPPPSTTTPPPIDRDEDTFIAVACLEPQFYRMFWNTLRDFAASDAPSTAAVLGGWGGASSFGTPSSRSDAVATAQAAAARFVDEYPPTQQHNVGVWDSMTEALQAMFLCLPRDVWASVLGYPLPSPSAGGEVGGGGVAIASSSTVASTPTAAACGMRRTFRPSGKNGANMCVTPVMTSRERATPSLSAYHDANGASKFRVRVLSDGSSYSAPIPPVGGEKENLLGRGGGRYVDVTEVCEVGAHTEEVLRGVGVDVESMQSAMAAQKKMVAAKL